MNFGFFSIAKVPYRHSRTIHDLPAFLQISILVFRSLTSNLSHYLHFFTNYISYLFISITHRVIEINRCEIIEITTNIVIFLSFSCCYWIIIKPPLTMTVEIIHNHKRRERSRGREDEDEDKKGSH